ncbi:BnaAnng27970D [Brassica napus]|uniref:BnaAnng27970D protein n=2 Tax=Brassica napus TaxID=3708 RepID=A0A078JSQ3_BRANA|nr:BnaAnng27970D [Brassica napus]
MVLQRASWEDDWEFAEVETTTIPRVVFSKPPSLQEAKEATDDLKDAINLVYTEGSYEAGSVSRMLSSFHLSDKRAVESAVPQVSLNAFAFLSESSAAQSVVASIASDPKVWDAVMENNDLMKFLDTNTTAASTQAEAADNDDKAEDSSESESEEDSEAKPIQLLEILEDMKLKAVQLMENVSSYFGGLFRSESFTENGEERKRTLLNDPTSLFGLAVCVIFMVVMKRA